MTVPYAFGSATTSIPLSQLDANFDTPITLGNTAIQLGNTVTTLNNMTLANTTFSTSTVISANSASDALRIAQTGSGNALLVEDSANPDSTPFVIDQFGRLIVGHTVNTVPAGTNPSVQVQSNGSTQSAILGWSATSVAPPTQSFYRSASGTVGTYGVVGSGFDLGKVSFFGDDGAAFIEAARILAEVDGTPGANDMPGRLVFSTTADGAGSATERMRIDSSGNVGIGTSSPTVKLELAGDAKFVTTSGIGLQLHNNSSNQSYLQFTNTVTGETTTSGFQVGIDADEEGLIWHYRSEPIKFATNNTERARITSGGEVYIAGTTDQGAYNLQCNGTGVWGAGAYVNGSDERIKEDIAPLTSGLDVVTKLNPVTYRYKEDWSKDQSIQPGFIAQEMLVAMEGQDYVDGVVSQGGAAGYYSVAYQNIIPLLTKAIQEQQQMIETLQAKVAALEGVKK